MLTRWLQISYVGAMPNQKMMLAIYYWEHDQAEERPLQEFFRGESSSLIQWQPPTAVSAVPLSAMPGLPMQGLPISGMAMQGMRLGMQSGVPMGHGIGQGVGMFGGLPVSHGSDIMSTGTVLNQVCILSFHIILCT
jgi:hypothetical protein